MNRKEVFNIVFNVIKKISNLKLDEIAISDYNKKYLVEYIDNPKFFSSLYTDLLYKSINKLTKPISESVLLDYGGGCGMLSFLAKAIGFKSVIYNDIYDVSVKDAEHIANALNSKIDFFICGDIDTVLSTLNQQKNNFDIICSFNVLEHIYNLDSWFSTLKTKTNHSFSLCFMTSANGSNPFIRKRLQKIHYNAEFVEKEKKYGWKERDAHLPFLEIRRNIIAEFDNNLEEDILTMLAKKTRGLIKSDILNVAKEYKKTGNVTYKLPYLTNTCDPYTGNWAENIIDLDTFRHKIEDNTTVVKFTNSKFGYTKNKAINFVKFILNGLISVLGKENLYFSHAYTLEIDFNR